MTDDDGTANADLYIKIFMEEREKCEVCSQYKNYVCGYHDAFFDGVERVLKEIESTVVSDG